MKHFENLWEEAEASAKTIAPESTQEEVLQELHSLIVSYKNFHESFKNKTINIPEDYVQISKERIFGNILFNIAHLSLLESIDVFSALTNAIKNSKISLFNKIR